MFTLLSIILSAFLISLGTLVGAIALILKQKKLESILLILISLSAGTLIGGAFFHLIPEALERQANTDVVFWIVLGGFIFFFLMEKILHWRHCHHRNDCGKHVFFGQLSLVGDGIHNFIDGLLIAASFAADFRLGVATTIAVALHEIPQEVGDFGLLIYSGYKKTRAIILNYAIALTVILGGIVGYCFSTKAGVFIDLALPFTAGGFLYIAMSDLIPEIKKETRSRSSILTFVIFILGLVTMYLLKEYTH
jgi:zinc and cadmium transporter